MHKKVSIHFGYVSEGREFQMDVHSIICRCLLYFFGFFPIKQNKVVFSSYYGKYYSDNPMYIFEAMTKKNVGLDSVWLLCDEKTKIKNARVVKKGSIKSLYELATAKIWIDNCRKPLWMRKRKKQYYVQTWHAGIGLKAGENACADKLSKKYVESAINDSKMANLFLANSDWVEKIYKTNFWYTGEILKKGIPREDALYKDSNEVHKKICSIYNEPSDMHFVLYAPTFRNNGSLKSYNMDYEKVIDALKEKTGYSWKIILRLHPNIKDADTEIPYSDIVLNGTQYNEINDLILASDILITDYSSCMFDGMIANKAVVIYASDIDEYKKERGYLFKWEELPFDIATNTDELIKIINLFKRTNYNKKVEAFKDTLGFVKGGNASEDVAKYIIEQIL